MLTLVLWWWWWGACVHLCVCVCVCNTICHVSLMFAFYSLITWAQCKGALEILSYGTLFLIWIL